MKTIKTTGTPERAAQTAILRELQNDAAALAPLTRESAAWQTLERRFRTALDDATEASTEMHLSAEDRAYLCGGALHLRELWRQLSDIQSGAWRSWPGMPAPISREGGEGSEGGEGGGD